MTPNGFDFLGVSPLIGRPLNDADAAPGAPPVGVMNYRTWMKHFGGDPGVLRRTMSINGEPRTVIGAMPPRFEWNIADLWLPASITAATIQVRHADSARAGVALVEPNRLEDMIQQAFYARPRFVMLILGIFAAAGLLLVAFGIYGVLAYVVSQQTREVAIRMALGGERRDVLRMVLRFGLQLVAVGTVLGLAASLMTNRLLATQLWNISAHDPATFAIVIAMIVVIALIACRMPAQRAVRVEPMVALRHD